MRSNIYSLRTSFSENRRPLFRDMRSFTAAAALIVGRLRPVASALQVALSCSARLANWVPSKDILWLTFRTACRLRR